ncbi:hypothetical protein [Aureibacter tunicatorum]|uniref:Uncharacterized protein n=1 Tax=Aureibacter tunicatorum TaxID=866807 RepID=A0AAE4BQ36_9BACT|nr:hypothetical protein [Aureibacter tunicatorum]MDR6237146.1 hypothetical protein [Aureibacter tunicatorum]BDD06138.1 hypothetical protein AUTU_36210 [Aureibacter tunicatorum]
MEKLYICLLDFLFIIYFSNSSVAEQIEVRSCNVDSTSQRVFVLITRENLEDMNFLKSVIHEIQAKFSSFEKLKISFYDDEENCGYKIEVLGDDPETSIIKNNDVKNHYLGDYDSEFRILKIFKPGNCFIVEREILLDPKK